VGEIVKDLSSYTPPVGESSWHKFEEGTTTIRILSHSYHYVSHYVHSEKKSYNCTGDISTCEWCQKGVKASNRWAYLILIRGDVPVVKPVEFGWSIFGTILELAKDSDYGDPRKYDLKISRKGTDKDTRYTVIPGKRTKFTKNEALFLKANNLDTLEGATEKLMSFYNNNVEPDNSGDLGEVLGDSEVEE